MNSFFKLIQNVGKQLSTKTVGTFQRSHQPSSRIDQFRHASSQSRLHQEEINPDDDKRLTKDVIERINAQLNQNHQGRLFAVVQIAGKQFKITPGDIVVVQGTWPPTAGDEISLDKILCVGAKEFSLFGRPILPPGLASVKATVIEKTLSHTRTLFRFAKRKQYRRIHFNRSEHTMLRINAVDVIGELNNPKSIVGLEGKMLQ